MVTQVGRQRRFVAEPVMHAQPELIAVGARLEALENTGVNKTWQAQDFPDMGIKPSAVFAFDGPLHEHTDLVDDGCCRQRSDSIHSVISPTSKATASPNPNLRV